MAKKKSKTQKKVEKASHGHKAKLSRDEYDYSRARDDMLAATHSGWAPWHIVHADNKRRARLNCISHLLSRIPYKKLPRDKVKLGKRDLKGKYNDQKSIAQFRFIPNKY